MRVAKLFESEKALILALIAGVALGLGLGWFTFPFLFPMFKNAGLASWIQAFGSIGAIVGAIIISKKSADYASRIEREKERRERDRLELGYRYVVENLIDELRVNFNSGGAGSYEGSVSSWQAQTGVRLKSNISAVVNLPLYDLGGKKRIDAVFLIKDLAIHFDAQMDSAVSGSNRDQAYRFMTNIAFNQYLSALERLERQFLDTYK